MQKAKLIVIFIASAIIAAGVVAGIKNVVRCRNQPPSLTEDVGTLVDIEVVPTSWNEHVKTRVKTTKGVFIVRSILSARFGAKCTIKTFPDGRELFFIKGKSYVVQQ